MGWERREWLRVAGLSVMGAAGVRGWAADGPVVAGAAAGVDDGAALEGWKKAKIAPVFKGARHALHAYFVHSPESPDGKYVLFYSSGDKDGGTGDLRVIERATGAETIVAKGITAEDAHRGACQQWSNGGKSIVYHDCRGSRWFVVSVELKTLKETILAEDHQIGFGRADQPWVPIYGCHWNPGAYRDLELVHVETRERKTVVKVEQVLTDCAAYVKKIFGEKPISIFFPVMSPDGTKVFFKLAAGSGGSDFRSKAASVREGKVVYALPTAAGEMGTFIRLFESWGHPAWHPDSSGILEKGNVVFSITSGQGRQLVKTPTDHPSFSPDARFFTSDADVSKRDFGKPGDWAVVVAPTQGMSFAVVDQFQNTKGAASWRRNHPHPAFSPDGKRLYYNVNKGEWTELYCAERADG